MQHAETRSPGAPTDTEDVHQFLTFTLGSEEYGIPILQVKEIRSCTTITPIPNAPRHVQGVMNLRGHVVPVVDLRARFGMPAAQEDRLGVTILVQPGSRVVGLAVDAVSDVLDVDGRHISPVPELTLAVERSLVTGMAHHDERLVLLLDVAAVIDAEALPTTGGAPAPEHQDKNG